MRSAPVPRVRKLVPSLLALLLTGTLGATFARAELRPDELLLVVNGNSADSVRLAEFYAKARLIPPGRICKLDLSVAEEIPFEVYERNVVPVVRKFIRDNGLKDKVRCLVTFYGTPIRVAAPKIGPEEQREIGEIRTLLNATERRLIAEVAAYEQYVRSIVPEFNPQAGAGNASPLDELTLRADRASRALGPAVNAASPTTRGEILAKVRDFTGLLIGDAGLVQRFMPIELADPAVTPATREIWTKRVAAVEEANAILTVAQDRRFDPTERARVRQVIGDHFGLVMLTRVLQAQVEYFGSDQAQAAFDSELAMLWQDGYPRSRWLSNPLHYEVAPRYQGVPILMVSRIDGPDEQTVPMLILASLKAERDGLRGRVVIDSRGMRINATQPANNAYAEYDQTLRNLAEILRKQNKLPLFLDERDAVIPGGTVRGVALYAGWYSVGNYVPACTFVPGAVGYHIASFEMTSLKDPANNGWVRGLLRDGICATAGPVAEPYLFSFPDADEFFPLLLTGRLTLAEAYWRTQKTTSWQMSLVGDPLYRPFARNPILEPGDLPAKLRNVVPAVMPPLTTPLAPPIHESPRPGSVGPATQPRS